MSGPARIGLVPTQNFDDVILKPSPEIVPAVFFARYALIFVSPGKNSQDPSYDFSEE